jgi:alkylation response protein AidB-like acyl-CoA dehydrogenase
MTIFAHPSEHAALLAESVADFVRRGTTVARVRALRETPEECDRDKWQELAELGWLGVLVPERFGGMGLGVTEAAIVAEELARGLVPEPFTATAVLAASIIAGADSEAFKTEVLPRVVAGRLLPAVAWQERAGELDPGSIDALAVAFEGGFRLTGVKRFIAGASGADAFLVSARLEGEIAMFWVPRNAAGTHLTRQRLADGRWSGTLSLADVMVPRERLVASPALTRAVLARALDRAAVVTGAELVGVMGRALEISLDYMRTRVQFGKPIGSFQALQHRAVDLYLQQELAGAVVGEAARALDEGLEGEARAALASRAKARACEAALRITREAIQLHGAIGYTDDCDIGLYLKRALTVAPWLGNATAHRRRYARLAASAAQEAA